MKMFVGFDVGREFEWCWAFTAHIELPLTRQWMAKGKDLLDGIKDRMRKGLDHQGIGSADYCFVIETRDRRGRFQTRPHIHGYLLVDDQEGAREFELALHHALFPALVRSGKTPTRRDVEVKPAFDRGDRRDGRLAWVSYITKNVSLWDQAISKRRLYISQSLTRAAREAWEAWARRADQ